MSGLMRRERIQKKSSPRIIKPRGGNFIVKPRWLLLVILYSLLLLLPFILGMRPVAEYVGMQALSQKMSRVDFKWNVPDIDRIEKEVESTHYPIFEEVLRSTWMSKVFDPVAALMEKAIDLRSPELLRDYAIKAKIDLSLEESRTIVDYVLKDMKKGLYADVLSPTRSILDTWIYSRGVISDKDYKEVDGSGARIEIIKPGNRFRQGRIAPLSKDTGPIPVSQVSRVLETAFYETPSEMLNSMRQVLGKCLSRIISKHPTLIYEKQLTADTLKERKDIALNQASHISIGDVLVEKGQKIGRNEYIKIRAENEAYAATLDDVRIAGELLGKLLLCCALCLFFVVAMFQRHKARAIPATALICLPLTALLYLLVFNGISLTLLPVGLLAGMISLGAGSTSGILATIAFTGFAYLVGLEQAGSLLALLTSSTVFSLLCPTKRFRMSLARASLFCGLVGALTFLCWHLATGSELILPQSFDSILTPEGSANLMVQSLWLIISWILSFILLTLCLPLQQPLFNNVSNIRLQDLQEHPLLEKLLREAPSSYYHSNVVSALSEVAAQSIGANSLLCKTACYYHDIGKLVKPEYFTENVNGISRHDSLTPQMSALIIISHVKDGSEMARQWRLPQVIIDIIEQHHGTTLVSFFLRQAREQAEDPDSVDEALFRYPGPRPQTPEAGACMIADSVEAASRSLDGASPARIRSLVHGIILGKLEDRQFDESGMNFTDLTKIEDALVHMLSSMFHSRIKYEKDNKAKRK